MNTCERNRRVGWGKKEEENNEWWVRRDGR